MAEEGRTIVLNMQNRDPEVRMARFRARFADSPYCPRPHCGGRLYFEWDDHQPVAICWNCGREIMANAIPALTSIEEYEPVYYSRLLPTRRRAVT